MFLARQIINRIVLAASDLGELEDMVLNVPTAYGFR
jgi:hypothetical protein